MNNFDVIELNLDGENIWSAPLVPEFIVGKKLTELDHKLHWKNFDQCSLIKVKNAVFRCKIILQTPQLIRVKLIRLIIPL